ncbi:MAG: hemerythrin domain-containing protein, partial [Mycobacterium sp.]
MPDEVLSVVLERQHREIDSGISTFIEKIDAGSVQPELLAAALEALRRHLYLEEIFLFPPIREAGMVMPIFVMMREHGELWRTMCTLT